MAVPTITSVSPNSGLTRGGNLVHVNGTNFRLPPTPPEGELQGNQPRTVSVKFEGVDSPWAYAATETEIYAIVPQYKGPTAVAYPLALDVRVANLDDDENEIAGENATLVEGYDYTRPSLATEPYLQRVIRELLILFKRHVIDNVSYTASRDAPSPTLDDTRLQTSTPSIELIGPRAIIDRFRSVNQEAIEEDGYDFSKRKHPVTTDLEFDVRLNATGVRQLHALTQSVMLFLRDVLFVRVLDNPLDDLENPTGTYKDYELDLVWDFAFDQNTEANVSDLYESTSVIAIRGVHIDTESGTIIEEGRAITENNGLPITETETK